MIGSRDPTDPLFSSWLPGNYCCIATQLCGTIELSDAFFSVRDSVQQVSDYFNSFLIIGRVGERLKISLNPARMNAEGMPVHAKAGGMPLSDLGSTG